MRKQADKCRQHANALSDNYAQVQLLKLADEHIARAMEIESKEKNNGSSKR
jgi:hypothetical protein